MFVLATARTFMRGNVCLYIISKVNKKQLLCMVRGLALTYVIIFIFGPQTGRVEFPRKRSINGALKFYVFK